MRRILNLAALGLAASSFAQNWSSLPQLPTARAILVTGNGNSVIAANGNGGMLLRSSDGSKKESSHLGATQISLVGDLLVFVNPDGLYYGKAGDTALRKAASLSGNPNFVFSQDGKNIVAMNARSISNGSATTSELLLSRDSVVGASSISEKENKAVHHGWRRIAPPNGQYWQYDAKAWIGGRILVASDRGGAGWNGRTWISYDTGATWKDSLPQLVDAVAIQGDTIVLRRYYQSSRLLVSRDGGSSWDSTTDKPYGDRGGMALRGGVLFEVVSGYDTVPDLLRSVDLGKTWDTVFHNVTNPEPVAWDGRYFWSRQGTKLVRFGRDGQDIQNMDQDLAPLGVAKKILGFGPTLLVLQVSGLESNLENGRLLAYSAGSWRVLRDSVHDVDVIETDTGLTAFVLVDPAPRRGRWWRLGNNLERSYNLSSWQILSQIAPQGTSLGRDSRGLLVGDTLGVAILTPSSTVIRQDAWTDQIDVYWAKNLSSQNGMMIWSAQNQLYSRTPGSAPVTLATSSSYIGAFASTNTYYGFLCTKEGNWRTLGGSPVKTATFGYPGQVCGADRYRGDTLAMWQGAYGLTLIGPSTNRFVYGPSNVPIVKAAWVPARSLLSSAPSKDSAFVLSDLVGGLHAPSDLVIGAAVKPNSVRQFLASRVHGGLRIELATSAMVGIEVVDMEGRRLSAPREVALRSGSNLVALEPVVSPGFALLRVDGKIAASVRMAPFSR
jgi:hypothetical protein